MKRILLIITSFLLFSFELHAQTPTTEEEINALWTQNKHDEIQVLLTTKMALTPPDVVALYCSKFFYMMVKPDKTKALEAATKLKQIADSSQNEAFVELASHELSEVQGTPVEAFVAPQAEQIAQLHVLFPNGFPNVKVGVNLKQYLAP
jgi:hypothetical protein